MKKSAKRLSFLMLRKMGIVALFSSLALCGLASAAELQPINGIVAIVNDGVITQSDLSTAVNLQKMEAAASGIALPPEKALQANVLQNLITQKAALELAEKFQITVSDADVTQAMDMILARNHKTKAEFDQDLTHFDLTEANYRQFLQSQLIIRNLAQKAIASNILVTPDEVNAQMRQQAQADQAKKTYHVAHILISFPANPTPEDRAKTKEKAESVFKEIQQGLDFKTAAMKYSNSDDAAKGGDLGDKSLDLLPTLFVDPVKSLKPGQTLAPFESNSGYHLVKLISIDDAKEIPHQVHQYQLQQIVIRTSPVVSDSQAKTILAHLRIALENGKSFETLARENSQDALSASNGGKMEFQSLSDLGPLYASVVQGLSPGQISQPFKIDQGWALVKLLGSREYDDSQDFKRKQATEDLFQKKAMEAINTWEAQLKGQSYVKIVDDSFEDN